MRAAGQISRIALSPPSARILTYTEYAPVRTSAVSRSASKFSPALDKATEGGDEF